MSFSQSSSSSSLELKRGDAQPHPLSLDIFDMLDVKKPKLAIKITAGFIKKLIMEYHGKKNIDKKAITIGKNIPGVGIIIEMFGAGSFDKTCFIGDLEKFIQLLPAESEDRFLTTSELFKLYEILNTHQALTPEDDSYFVYFSIMGRFELFYKIYELYDHWVINLFPAVHEHLLLFELLARFPNDQSITLNNLVAMMFHESTTHVPAEHKEQHTNIERGLIINIHFILSNIDLYRRLFNHYPHHGALIKKEYSSYYRIKIYFKIIEHQYIDYVHFLNAYHTLLELDCFIENPDGVLCLLIPAKNIDVILMLLPLLRIWNNPNYHCFSIFTFNFFITLTEKPGYAKDLLEVFQKLAQLSNQLPDALAGIRLIFSGEILYKVFYNILLFVKLGYKERILQLIEEKPFDAEKFMRAFDCFRSEAFLMGMHERCGAESAIRKDFRNSNLFERRLLPIMLAFAQHTQHNTPPIPAIDQIEQILRPARQQGNMNAAQYEAVYPNINFAMENLIPTIKPIITIEIIMQLRRDLPYAEAILRLLNYIKHKARILFTEKVMQDIFNRLYDKNFVYDLLELIDSNNFNTYTFAEAVKKQEEKIMLKRVVVRKKKEHPEWKWDEKISRRLLAFFEDPRALPASAIHQAQADVKLRS